MNMKVNRYDSVLFLHHLFARSHADVNQAQVFSHDDVLFTSLSAGLRLSICFRIHNWYSNEKWGALATAGAICDISTIDGCGVEGSPFLCGGAPQGWPPWKLSTRS